MSARPFFVLVAAVAVLGAWPSAAPQTPTPTPQPQVTFRAEGNYIEVDAIVTDSQGNFVRDLKSSDFQIAEDKKPQAVDIFSLVDIPLERPDTTLGHPNAIPPDVATNEKGTDGRLYVMVLDGNHIQSTDTAITKKVALQFIDQALSANDQAAVILLQGGTADTNQEFTADKAALRASVQKFVGEKVQWKAINVLEQIKQRAGVTGWDPKEARDLEATERARKASDTLNALTQMSNSLAGVRGRKKAVVFFSEGLDFNTDDVVGPRSNTLPDDPMSANSSIEAIQAQTLLDEMQLLYNAATHANVAIYSVDPRGPVSEPDVTISMTGGPDGVDPKMQSMAISALRADVRRQLGTLRTFSEATGGIATVGTNDFTGGFRRVVDDNTAYYVLGYHPTELKQDGKFHDITVRVTRPGLQVRARKGYYAAKPSNKATPPPADPTIALLNSPMAVSGLGLRLATNTLKGDAQNVRVQMTIELAGADLAAATTATDGKVDLTYAVIDGSAAVKASGRKSLDLALKPETRAAIAASGLRLVTELQVPPGRYQLRLAANAAGTGKSGSVFTSLEVPDFTKGPISMGNLAITSSSASKMPSSIDATGIKDLLPGPPTTSRTFALEDTLVVLAQVYDNDADKPHTVDLTAIVKTDDGTQAFVGRETRDAAEIGTKGYPYVSHIPLQDLVPGRYVLTVQAKSRLGGDPATKEVEFTIK